MGRVKYKTLKDENKKQSKDENKIRYTIGRISRRKKSWM